MINTILRHKKLARKRTLQSDYKRHRNINRYLPSEMKEETIPVFRSVTEDVQVGYPPKIEHKQVFNKKGIPIVEKVGTRTILKRVKKPRPKDEHGNDKPLIQYPVSKKYRLGKKEIQRRKVAIGNIFKTATSH